MTTGGSAKLQLALQSVEVHDESIDLEPRQLHEKVGPVQSRDFGGLSCEISPREYQWTAAAKRISFTNSSGDRRKAENTPSGSCIVTVVIAVILPWEILRPFVLSPVFWTAAPNPTSRLRTGNR